MRRLFLSPGPYSELGEIIYSSPVYERLIDPLNQLLFFAQFIDQEWGRYPATNHPEVPFLVNCSSRCKLPVQVTEAYFATNDPAQLDPDKRSNLIQLQLDCDNQNWSYFKVLTFHHNWLAGRLTFASPLSLPVFHDLCQVANLHQLTGDIDWPPRR